MSSANALQSRGSSIQALSTLTLAPSASARWGSWSHAGARRGSARQTARVDRTPWPGALFASPVLRSVAPFAARLARFDGFPSVRELDEVLRDRLAFAPGVTLEPQVKVKRRRTPRTRDALYEVRIEEHRLLPTRERSWHDLANALVWAAFPRSKRALTARQHAILTSRIEDVERLPVRTREQDGLAMVDEGGLLVMARGGLERVRAALDAGDEASLARSVRDGEVELLAFGHALMEHAIGGELEVRAYAIALEMDVGPEAPLETRVEAADRALAAWIASRAETEPAERRGVLLSRVLG